MLLKLLLKLRVLKVLLKLLLKLRVLQPKVLLKLLLKLRVLKLLLNLFLFLKVFLKLLRKMLLKLLLVELRPKRRSVVRPKCRVLQIIIGNRLNRLLGLVVGSKIRGTPRTPRSRCSGGLSRSTTWRCRINGCSARTGARKLAL